MDGITVTAHRTPSVADPMEDKVTIAATLTNTFRVYAERGVFEIVCEKIAERYVEEHYAEIAGKLDQNAIANLAVAAAGRKIAEEIRTRPVVLHEKTTNHISLF